MSVAIAVRHGLPASTRRCAPIGLDAARILGVDDRVGTLEKGKDADFVVLSGEPLAIGTMVEVDVDRRRTRVRAPHVEQGARRAHFARARRHRPRDPATASC